MTVDELKAKLIAFQHAIRSETMWYAGGCDALASDYRKEASVIEREILEAFEQGARK